ncbi:unnamed protein product [Symbiodinium sp. CCMP2592]|nr:unnamed protein product [Symbiodinium sp. CCMP2592]
MPQQSEAKYLWDLTEVPAGWSLATVIDAFVHLAAYAPADRALEALNGRLVELWASQPAEAQAWLERLGELNTATRAERLCEALRRHGAAECGKYKKWGGWRFSEAGLLREEPCRPAAERERLTALYLLKFHTRARCRELVERLEQAESQETARKRQKLEEEPSESRRLEAKLQSSQEECEQLRSRLAAAEAEVSDKASGLQAAQSESEELAHRAAAAESAAAQMQKELWRVQEEHSQCQERCEDLAHRLEAAGVQNAQTKEAYAAAEKQFEVQRTQGESCSYHALEGSKAELQIQNAVLQERCDQLRQQLAKAEAKVDLLQGLREEIGMYKERLREQVIKTKSCHRLDGGGGTSSDLLTRNLTPAPSDAAVDLDDEKSDLAEQLGYSLVDEDGASVLSGSSGYSVQQDCFMLDAIFKSRMDFFCQGKDLQKGSQVVAGDGETILEVVEISKESQATNVVDLQAGQATLRVTPDHPVQVPDEGGNSGRPLYMPAGKLKVGEKVMLDSGERVALTSAETRPMECSVLKIVFEPDLPVAVFSSPSCILSKGHKKKTQAGRRGGMCQRGKEASDPMDGASIPDTAAGEYMD